MLNQSISAFSESFSCDSSANVADISVYGKKAFNSATKWKNEVARRLKELISLDPGWDGYQGIPVKPANAAFAYQVIMAICDDQAPAPQLVPGSNGDLQIEWHTLRGDIELHILGPNNVRAWCAMVGEDADGIEFDLTNNFADVASWVKGITESEIGPTAAVA